MKKTLIILQMLVFFFTASTATAQTSSMYMQVDKGCTGQNVLLTFYGRNDALLKGVDVDVVTKSAVSGTRKVAYGTSDDYGTFSFVPDKEGSYDITAKKEGYKTITQQVKIEKCPTTTSTTTTTSSSLTRSTTTSSTTSTRKTTTTTSSPQETCNGNGVCEPNENYRNCPVDCSGKQDGVCDTLADGTCDPDCSRVADPDCRCNNDTRCESNYGENSQTCPNDCKSGQSDGACDRMEDGICDPDCTKKSEDPDCGKIDWAAVLGPLLLIIGVFAAMAYVGIRWELSKKRKEELRTEMIEKIKERLRNGDDPKDIRKELVANGHDVSLLEKAEADIWH